MQLQRLPPPTPAWYPVRSAAPCSACCRGGHRHSDACSCLPQSRARVTATTRWPCRTAATAVARTARGNNPSRVTAAAAHSTDGAQQTAAQPQPVDRDEHNRRQAETFDAVSESWEEDRDPEILQRLDRIVGAVPRLGPGSRVLDVGSGAGALIPHLQSTGVADVLALDLSAGMLGKLRRRFADPGTLGNEPGVRTWQGDIGDLPAFQGPFDAVFFNAVFGNVADQKAALTAAALRLKPGGHAVISHPLGRPWLQSLHEADPATVPHTLPEEYDLMHLIADLPLRLVRYMDTPDLYCAVLQVPPGFYLQSGPRRLAGEVTSGFGRGSAKLGFPTANLPPEPLADALAGLPSGVYFGWASLKRTPDNESRPAADFETHKMVMNIGLRPTMEDGAALTVEAHVLQRFSGSFYGEPLRVIATGFLRPEVKFSGLDQLIARIQADIGLASAQLELPGHSRMREDPFLTV